MTFDDQKRVDRLAELVVSCLVLVFVLARIFDPFNRR